MPGDDVRYPSFPYAPIHCQICTIKLAQKKNVTKSITNNSSRGKLSSTQLPQQAKHNMNNATETARPANHHCYQVFRKNDPRTSPLGIRVYHSYRKNDDCYHIFLSVYEYHSVRAQQFYEGITCCLHPSRTHPPIFALL